MLQICFSSRTSRTLFLILAILCVFVFAIWNSNLWQIGFIRPSHAQLLLPFTNGNNRMGQNRILPTIIPPKAWVRYPGELWKGYQLPLLTAYPRGRFGNMLMGYATLYALSCVYNVSAVLHPEMKKHLKYFDNIYLQDLPGTYNSKEWTTVQSLEKNIFNYAPLELAASGLLGPHRFIIQQWPHEIQLLDYVRRDIRQQFTWNKNITNKVQIFFRNIEKTLKKKFVTEPVFIGVHIRRTDYVKHIKRFGGSQMPTSLYFKRAFDYYKNKYNDTYFIISTDDKAYVNKEFKLYKDDISLTPGSSPQEDMAILNACNHSIITIGTFSFWTAYLAGGEVLYPDLTFTNKDFYFARPYYEGVGLYFKPIAIV